MKYQQFFIIILKWVWGVSVRIDRSAKTAAADVSSRRRGFDVCFRDQPRRHCSSLRATAANAAGSTSAGAATANVTAIHTRVIRPADPRRSGSEPNILAAN